MGTADIFVSGVYNGGGTSSPSHRARLDNPIALLMSNASNTQRSNGGVVVLGAACRDLAAPSMLVRLCDPERDIRVFAHRTRRHLWVGVPSSVQWNRTPIGEEDFTTLQASSMLAHGPWLCTDARLLPSTAVTRTRSQARASACIITARIELSLSPWQCTDHCLFTYAVATRTLAHLLAHRVQRATHTRTR